MSRMIICNPGEPTDDRRKPLRGSGGILLTRAPRWYLEAIGVVVRNQ
ncbi:MAG: hypothetical protein R3335_13450 [Anaerolineales bacterium]|nr:hypothetical protein [Anaerolineales bacterium]